MHQQTATKVKPEQTSHQSHEQKTFTKVLAWLRGCAPPTAEVLEIQAVLADRQTVRYNDSCDLQVGLRRMLPNASFISGLSFIPVHLKQ